jgi:hypothetical protein
MRIAREPAMNTLFAVLCGMFAFAAADDAPPHPRVCVTAADVKRSGQAIEANAEFRQRIEELTARSQATGISDLPGLERAWWDQDRGKPWADTYPQIFHHTWIVPEKWSQLARDCAWCGLLQPKSGLAAKSREVLLKLSDYTFEFEHFDVGMNYTVWMLDALECYDLQYGSFSADERGRIDAFVDRYLAAVKKNDAYWVEHEPGGAINNHYAWHKLGILAVGLFYSRPELVTEALDGPKGIEFLIRHGFTDDGLWMEGSIPYQFAATIPLVRAAELLKNAGHARDLYVQDTGDGRTVKGAYDALLPLLMPDRTLPTIGDCYGRRPQVGLQADWEVLCRRFGDPQYAWLLSALPRRSPDAVFVGLASLPAGTPPVQTSRLWPEHGYAALRSQEGTDYWTGRGWSLFATYSSSPVHQNFDKLSFMLYADSHLWLPDCEAVPSEEHSFSSAIQRELNRQTLCHNTLLVDQRSQRHPQRPLQLVEFQILHDVKRVTMADLEEQLYPGVTQMRTCIVRPEYVLDFFQVAAGEPRDLAWMVHVDGQSERNRNTAPGENLVFPTVSPWKYLKSPERIARTDRYGETFRDGNSTLRIDVLSSQPQDIVRCGFPQSDREGAPGTEMRMLQSNAAQAWYAAVYRKAADAALPLECAVTAGELGNWTVAIQFPGRRFVHRVPKLTPPASSEKHASGPVQPK